MDSADVPRPIVVSDSMSANQQLYEPVRTNFVAIHPQSDTIKPPTVQRVLPKDSKEERGKAFRQVVAAFIANLGTINTGLVFGFSAVVIPQLEQEDSVIPIDENQASWIGT